MATQGLCPSCHGQLTPESATDGLCLGCLLTTALEPDDDDQETGSLGEPQVGTLAPGTKVGRYSIDQLLGKGGMATVYEAREAPPLERTVALKVLPPEFLHDDTFAARFAREAQVVASLEHANIVPIYASGIDNGLPWMSMRLLGGGNLSELLREGPLPADRVSRILRDVADALDHAHRAGVIHRDIKPSNILLDQTGRAWVSDFGVARLVEAPGDCTTTGTVVGTPHYMAPEQASGAKADSACDIYSLGVVAYEMLTGSPPFHGDSAIAILMRHVHEPVPRPARGIVPGSGFAVLKKALAKNPADRWRSAAEFVSALETSLQRPPLTAWNGLRSHAARATGAMVTLSLLVFLWPGGRPPLEDTVLSEPLDLTLTEPEGGESVLREMASEQQAPAQPVLPSTAATRATPVTVHEPPDATRPASRDPAPASTAPSEENDQPGVSAAVPPADLRAHGDVPYIPPSAVTVLPGRFEQPSAEPRPDVVTEPVLIAKVDPRYPDIAKRLSIRGDVVLRVLVGPDGSVTPVEVLRSPHSSLSDAAKRAVQQWRYRPALRNGVPISSHAEIKVTFRFD